MIANYKEAKCVFENYNIEKFKQTLEKASSKIDSDFIMKVDFSLEQIDIELKQFLIDEFVLYPGDKDWYLMKHSRSNYFRLREKATREFMRIFLKLINVDESEEI